VPGNLCALPRAKVGVEFSTKLEDFALEAFEFEFTVLAGSREAPKFLDILFEALDLLLAIESRRGFFIFSRGHQEIL
jgi:hypothetical protein